ncbi:Tyrosine-protein phosphatase non-receptor type 22 [Actinomortierella wolfii]|nr:Tyrosine-protein phosphatase non-receptor type 22 [Actinomortierella wolfii]
MYKKGAAASASAAMNAAGAGTRLPAFLRIELDSPSIMQKFERLSRDERERLRSAFSPGSPFSLLEATDEDNMDENRYRDILPYRRSQVQVQIVPGSQTLSSSYINANRITAPMALRASLPPQWPGYIATQAPLPRTQAKFWRMIQDQHVDTIVCLTAVAEDRRFRAQKAERYWPLAGQTDEYDGGLLVKSLETTDDYKTEVAYRFYEISNKGSAPRKVLLVQYQGWPDHGVPRKTDKLEEMLYRIRAWKKDPACSPHPTPIVVHCSAGCGRTGTFCAIDTALTVLEHTGYPYLRRNTVPPEHRSLASPNMYNWQAEQDLVFDAASSFRLERMLMIQTASQYQFCYRVLQELCHY